MFLSINTVSAKEVFYRNNNGVTFTEEEYEFLSMMFWDGCQDLFSKVDYEKFINSNIMNGTINTNSNDFNLLADYSEITDRSLKISTSCSSDCFVSITLTWKIPPSVRSYDVIGAYLEGTSLIEPPKTYVYTDEVYLQKFNNGFGASVKLPTGNNQIIVSQYFSVRTGGRIYASYQHAMSPISLANSKNYTISRYGYGGVFKFSGTAVNIYDRMTGVDIAL